MMEFGVFALVCLFGWTVLATSDVCSNLTTLSRQPFVLTDQNNKYGLWPGFLHAMDASYGENIYGVLEAMEIIWQNQNPPDCSKAKYFLAGEWKEGFGSEFYFHGVALALAMDTGRVLVQQGGFTWRYQNDFCRQQTGLSRDTLECYILPFSKCTVEDAMNAIQKSDDIHKHPQVVTASYLKKHRKQLYQFTAGKKSVVINRISDIVTKYPHGPAELRGSSINDGIIMVTNDLILEHHFNIIPYAMRCLLVNSGLAENTHFLWWRTISITYLLRPNKYLLALLSEKRDKTIQSTQGHCVSTYVRHGDKSIEMKLQPFSVYADVALKLFDKLDDNEHRHTVNYLGQPLDNTNCNNNGNNSNNSIPETARKPRVLYVASEDYQVFQDAKEWGKKHNIKVIFSELSQNILKTTANNKALITPKNLQKSLPKHREMEYFSYYLHLFDVSQCVYTICTHASNFCRVIDSFRSTVGGKANQYSVDLSPETCEHPPCYRKYSLGNYKDTLFNPNVGLW